MGCGGAKVKRRLSEVLRIRSRAVLQTDPIAPRNRRSALADNRGRPYLPGAGRLARKPFCGSGIEHSFSGNDDRDACPLGKNSPRSRAGVSPPSASSDAGEISRGARICKNHSRGLVARFAALKEENAIPARTENK